MEKEKLQSLAIAFNMRRQAMIGKELTREQMYNELRTIGFSTDKAKLLIAKGYIEKKKSGKNASKIYMFKGEPLNIKQLENLSVGSSKKSSFNEEKVIHDLQIRGFKVLKPIGFDEEKFRKENPELYKKYLRYEQA